MDLNLHHLVVHELVKEADSVEASLFLTENTLPVEERAEALVARLDRTFVQKEDTLQGFLSPPEDALFPGYFQHWQEQPGSDEAFLTFTRDTMNALKLSLQGVVGAKGGYLVYADYTVFETRMLGIFLVRDTEGVVFDKRPDEAAFALHTITYLNTDKLAMACRIKIDRQAREQGRYVELIKHNKSQKEISEYFLAWIGLERPESSKDLTATFLSVVDRLPLPTNETTGEPVPEGDFREEVVNFAMKNPQKTINLQAFNEQFYGDQPVTQSFLQENEIELENEFRYDRGAMKRFNNHKVSAEGLYLYFKRNHLTDGQVRVEGENIVIHSPELAEQLADILMDLNRE